MLPEGFLTVKLFFAAFSLFLLFFFLPASPPISACDSQPGFHLGQPRFLTVYPYIVKKEKLFYRKNEQKNTKAA